jgi:cysteine desulfurase/selenocysteine lyase
MSIGRLANPQDFPACQKLTYLNAASAALMYKPAGDDIVAWQADLAENGTFNFDERAEEQVFDGLHAAAAQLLDAKPADIAAGSSATELLSSLAWSMIPHEGQNIVGTAAAHPSTIYPWQRVARLAGCEVRLASRDEIGFVDPKAMRDLIDEHTAILALSHVEYRTGQLYDLRELAAAIHPLGGALVVDATQSAGHVPIHARACGADAIVASGYKWLCGPFGAAVMYLAPSLQDRLDPGLVGWRSHREMWDFRAERLSYPRGARRFEASTMAYGCALGLAKAIDFLAGIGVDRISAHNISLTRMLGDEVEARGGRILRAHHTPRTCSILSFVFPGRDMARIAAQLYGCGVVISERGGVVRVSPHLYNDEDDIGRMVQALDQVLSQSA